MTKRSIRVARLCGAIAAALLAAGFAEAADVYVEPVATVGEVPPDKPGVIAELIRNSLQANGHTVAQGPAPSVIVLRPKIIRQDELYSMTIEKALDGVVVFAAKTGPGSMDSIQGNVDLLVRSAMSGKPPEKELRVGEVPPEKAAPMPHRKPSKQWMLGFGPMFVNHALDLPRDDKSGGPKPNVALARLWYLEDTALSLFVEGTFIDGSDRIVNGGLAAAYFFSRQDASPFVSADVGYGGAIRDKERSRDGFVFGALAGFQFFRTSEINLEVAYRFFSLVPSNGGRCPAGNGLRVALHF